MMNKFLSATWLLLFLGIISCSKPSSFKEKMDESVQTSLEWRTDSTGIWETAGWWNSANVLTATIRYAAVTGDQRIPPIIDDVFEKAKHYRIAPDSLGNERFADNFINDYYDDEGWWALAWIEAYKLTGEKKYLEMSKVIFADMTTGWSDKCGGGIYWKKNPFHYKNAIANDLFSLTAIRLYQATNEQQYADWFKKNVEWFMQSGMINTNLYQIEDGTDNNCQPNRNAHYTYNQGVAIAVLAEMYQLSGDSSYLDLANQIAKATITKTLVTKEGILREMRPEIPRGNDGVQFKGIFIRHLAFLYSITKEPLYKEFILKNAHSILANNFDTSTKSFGCFWQGPLEKIGPAANASALECIIEAYQLETEE